MNRAGLMAACACAGLLVTGSSSVHAQAVERTLDMDALSGMELEDILNQVVVTATKVAQRVQDAPAVISVVTREDMERWGYRSVAEALTHVVGFYVLDDHILPNAAVRGVSAGLRGESSILKVMVDGHSVAFRPTSGNWLGPELIPLSAVDRIEIIRGPASALYGADAFLGVVNIITRSPEKLSGGSMHTSVLMSGENPGGGLDMAIGTKHGDTEFLSAFRLHYEDRTGLKLPRSSPAPLLPNYARDRAASGLTQYSAVAYGQATRHFRNSSITTRAYASVLDRGAEFADWEQLANGVDGKGRFNENRVSLAHGHVDVRYESHPLEQLDVVADLMGFWGRPTPRDRIEVGSDMFYVRRQFFSRGVDAEVNLRWRPWQDIMLMAGLTNTTDMEDKPQNLRVLKTDISGKRAGDTVGETDATSVVALNNLGVQLQGIWSVIPEYVSMTTSLRYDLHNVYGSHLSVRLASVFRPTRELAFKLFYGSAFKAPSTMLLYGTPFTVGDIIGNPDLKASHVHTAEAQVSYQLTPYVSWNTGLAYNYLVNKAEFVRQDMNMVARNLGVLQSYSLESQLDLHFKEWLRAYANVGLNQTRRKVTTEGYQAQLVGAQNVVYPAVIVNAGALVSIPGVPASVGSEVSAVSERRASEANILEQGRSYWLDPVVQWGGIASFTGLKLLPNRETTLSLVVRNLFDHNTPDPGFSRVDFPPQRRLIMLNVGQQL